MYIEILGPLTVSDGSTEIEVSGSKRRTLLTALATHANQAMSLDRLADWLWSSAPPRSAHLVIQAHVSVLRRSLEADPVRPAMLLTRSTGYLLRLMVSQLDKLRFEDLVGLGHQALREGRPELAARKLDEALSLWRGDALSDARNVAPAQSEIARLEELRVSASALQVEASMQMQHYDQVVPLLRRLIMLHPFHERFYAQLMLALVGSGRRAEALEVFRRARRTLAEELGIEPGVELRRLEASILNDGC